MKGYIPYSIDYNHQIIAGQVSNLSDLLLKQQREYNYEYRQTLENRKKQAYKIIWDYIDKSFRFALISDDLEKRPIITFEKTPNLWEKFKKKIKLHTIIGVIKMCSKVEKELREEIKSLRASYFQLANNSVTNSAIQALEDKIDCLRYSGTFKPYHLITAVDGWGYKYADRRDELETEGYTLTRSFPRNHQELWVKTGLSKAEQAAVDKECEDEDDDDCCGN